MTPSRERVDVLIVGGGPVGLHAALKAAILNHDAFVVDKGSRFSRACQAAAYANIPARPGFLSGAEILEQGREAIRAFERESGKRLVTVLEETEAFRAERTEGGFRVHVRRVDGSDAGEVVEGRVLILATGVVDRKPGIDAFTTRGHRTLAPFVQSDAFGYCVLCEGWSVADARVCVIGRDEASVSIACDLAQHFDADVVLLTHGERVEDVHGRVLGEAGIRLDDRLIEEFEEHDGRVRIRFAEGSDDYDRAFFALGWYKANNELAVALGAKTTREGYVETNRECEALDAHGDVIEGLYVVGDLRAGTWKQIVIGWGDAETAVITAYARRL